MSDELKKLDELVKSVNRGGYFRCSICDCVSMESIATNIGDYKPNMPFVNDPKDPLHFICVECDESVSDQLWDYEVFDEIEEGE
jgi:hypothetical protein